MEQLKPADWTLAKFSNLRFFVPGKFEQNDPYKTKGWIERVIRSEAGIVVDELDATVNYVVIKSPIGVSATEKRVEKLNAKGASIQVLSPQTLRRLIVPIQEEVEALVRMGPPGHELLAQRLELAGITAETWQSNKLSTQFLISHWDVSKQDLTCAPLWCLSLQNCDLRETRIERNLHQLQAVGPMVACNVDSAQLCCSFHSQQDCSFRRAELSGSRFQVAGKFVSEFKFAKLVGCDFTNSDISGSDFSGAILRGATLESVTAHSAIFQATKLQSVQAKDADFTGSCFINADLEGANLTGAILANCDFKGAKLRNAVLIGAYLTGACIDGTDFTGADLALANLDGADTSKCIGLTPTQNAHRTQQKILELESALKGADHFCTSISAEYRSQPIRLQLQYDEFGRYSGQFCATWTSRSDSRFPSWEETSPSLVEAMTMIISALPGVVPTPHSVLANAAGIGIPEGQLLQLATASWCEAFDLPIPTVNEIKKYRLAETNRRLEELDAAMSLLKRGDVKAWNKFDRSTVAKITPFSQADFSGIDLDGVNLESLVFKHSEFLKTSLHKANLARTIFEHCNFHQADLRNAVFFDADLSTSIFTNADLCGAQFASARMPMSPETDLQQAYFDEYTQFPDRFPIPTSMNWVGNGVDPRNSITAAPASGLTPVTQLMSLLRKTIDRERIDKALAMLKAERFQLYSVANDTSLIGVVRSQSDASLVYSCRLTCEGDYSCCTQNLFACGGLRGSLCKHLLMLIISLTQHDQLDALTIDAWIRACVAKRPKLDKVIMGDAFLRYQGAESGELQWRPMETIPEDFYAL